MLSVLVRTAAPAFPWSLWQAWARCERAGRTRGVPLKVIQELMGHVTIEMTERYAHLSPDTRREAVGVPFRPFVPVSDIRATQMEKDANHQ